MAIPRCRADIRDHGAADGRYRWCRYDLLFDARCFTAERNGSDVLAHGRLPFGAMAEAGLQPRAEDGEKYRVSGRLAFARYDSKVVTVLAARWRHSFASGRRACPGGALPFCPENKMPGMLSGHFGLFKRSPKLSLRRAPVRSSGRSSGRSGWRGRYRGRYPPGGRSRSSGYCHRQADRERRRCYLRW